MEVSQNKPVEIEISSASVFYGKERILENLNLSIKEQRVGFIGQWRDLNGIFLMKVLSIMTVSSIALHSIIGLWGVITDYITVRLLGPKAVKLNLIFQIGMIAITLVYLVWAISIIWSI